jgi:uncharacterized coiled-coil protein SlyX
MDLLEREEQLLKETDLQQYNYISSLQQQIREKKAEMRRIQHQIDALQEKITNCVPSIPVCRDRQLRESLDSYNRDLRIAYLTGQITRKEFMNKLSRRRKKYILFEQAVLEELKKLGGQDVTQLCTAEAPGSEYPPLSV